MQIYCSKHFKPDHAMPDEEEYDPDEWPDEIFRFVKIVKHS